jgi:NAD(P)-dependent dehydrogenase (short-subunit alcohol dehydrogenase family)
MTLPGNNLAIVTGASRGLGRLIALELAAAGIDVLIIGRDRDALAKVANEAQGPTKAKVYPLPIDLEAPGAVDAIAERAQQLGGVSILINNAAIQGPIGAAWEVDAAAFERTMRVDFALPVTLCRAVLPGMIARGGGWIVNISGGGATGPRPMFSAYGAAKTALVRFGETLAAEVAGRGVRVNSVAPGAFSSGITREVVTAGGAADVKETQIAAQLIEKSDDSNARKAAKLVLYLVGGKGRDITGKLISAVWDPWNEMHNVWEKIANTDIYTLRRIVPSDRDTTRARS